MGFLVPERSLARWLGLIPPLIGMAALGAVHLAAPLGPPQAGLLASVAAPSHIESSQPALTFLYLAASRMFGLNETAVHALELAILAAMAGFMAVTLTRHLRHQWVAVLAPLATAGVYYQFVPFQDLAQSGMMACAPLYACLWLATAYWSSPPRRVAGHFFSGVAGAVAALFHPLMGAIPLMIWIIETALARLRDHNRVSCILSQRLLPALVGFIGPVAAVRSFSQWDLSSLPAPAGTPDLDRYAVLTAAPWVLLGLVAIARMRDRIWAHPFWLMVAAWAAIAPVTQAVSIWAAATPFGLLSLAGIDEAMVLLKSRGLSARVATAVVLPAALLAPMPAMAVWVAKARSVPEGVLLLDPEQSRQHRVATDSDYDYAWRDTRFLTKPDAGTGTILICGGPFHYLAIRDFAPRRAMWLEALPPEREAPGWVRLRDELRAKRPAYLFLDQTSRARFLRDTSPDRAWFDGHYELMQQSSAGAWYRPIASVSDMSRVYRTP
ncbi:MAG: hypothetical protein R2762_21015 [Bryobacteraceae bacterium]